MAEAAPVVPNNVTAQNAITASEAASRYRAQRQAQGNTNPVSEAARTLGQRAGEALRARRAEAAAKTQEAEGDKPEAGEHVEDDQTPTGEAQDEVTASADTPDENAPEQQDDPDNGMIDLGEGVSMSKDEVREGILLKADHTRRLMELAEVKKQLESDRTQRLSLLDNAVVAAQQLLGQPKDPEALIEEFGMDEGMKAYFRQVKQFETLGNVIQARQQEQARHLEGLKQSTIKELSAKHGEKSEEIFSKAVQAVASKTGTDPKQVEAMLSHPEAVELVNDALKWREMEANKPKVAKMVAGKPAVIKPGAKVSAQATAQNRVQKAEATLKHSGKLADAVALLRANRASRTG